ncbi:MAG: DNA repair protein RecO [Candidatus Portnoybacteria bacterium RBG_19FT_COMBO_36_7]|uniref:DNA repair protein RecO n=1 Tax=Candidatus Portnoybacteria bacterium RBG_19FT_COMBO_36_7 TaxID=1801992 RepID=A0A1G2F7C4_9BACT|nr:MAG: DNA repair protein RecO [Candidatus Portnoybacteria bacterium RBG_19FT_COMBO_36_7]
MQKSNRDFQMEISVYKTEGIILKKADLSETDRLLTVYTKNFGKILVRAKGIGKKESKLKSLIEPFNIYELMLARSRNIDVLANSYAIKEFNYLRGNLENLALAIYFGELADKLIAAPEPDDKIWALLVRAFLALDQKRGDLAKIKEAFEKKLLEFLGHPSFSIISKSTEREKLHYLQSLAGEEINSIRFLKSLSLTS